MLVVTMASLLWLISLYSTAVLAAPAADEVDALPGWSSPLPSKQYSGFLTVGTEYAYIQLISDAQRCIK